MEEENKIPEMAQSTDTVNETAAADNTEAAAENRQENCDAAETAPENSETNAEVESVVYDAAPISDTIVENTTTDIAPKPQKHKNNGLKVFIAIIAVVVAVAVIASVGYFANGNNSGSGTGISTNINKKPTDVELTTAQEVYYSITDTVVGIMIYSPASGSVAYASGVVYTADGYIVTNDHIYSEIAKPSFKVRLYNGQIYDAKYVAGDTRSDLAVLKIDASGLKAAKFADVQELLVGEQVITVGYPAGIYEAPIMTSGTISSVGRRITSSSTSYSNKFIQTDAAINPGNSGGALVNMFSQVVGITSSKLAGTDYDRIGFAIPANTVVKIADSLINHGHVEGRARLGITYQEVDLVTAEVNNCPSGLKVASVSEESDLHGKNISENDIITHINDEKITNSAVALDIIDASKPGDVVRLTVYKAGTGKTLTLTATMLNDPGSSSYTTVQADNNTSSGSGGTFDFPFGD